LRAALSASDAAPVARKLRRFTFAPEDMAGAASGCLR
jgi:hypothetical protein